MNPVALLITGAVIGFTPFAAIALWHIVPYLFHAFLGTLGSTAGWFLRKTEGRRALIIRATKEGEANFREKNKSAGTADTGASKGWKLENGVKNDSDWAGIVGFFHPFCNAGGGGERVLWAAIRATQQRWPKAKIVVYTGDHDVTKDKILSRVKVRFIPPQIRNCRHRLMSTRPEHLQY